MTTYNEENTFRLLRRMPIHELEAYIANNITPLEWLRIRIQDGSELHDFLAGFGWTKAEWLKSKREQYGIVERNMCNHSITDNSR